MKKKLNVFDKLKWKGDEAIADGSDIVDLVQDNPDLFEEVGGKQGVGIYLAEDGNYVYIVHFFYGDTAFSDWEHSAKLYRVDQETEQFCEDYKVYHTRQYKIVDGWEICRWSSSWVFNFNRLYFLDDSWRKRCRNPIVYREQAAIHELLNMLINTPRDYGYYFSKTHKHDQPKELDNLEFQVIYSTPVHYYRESGEYNCISVAYTEDYTYYAISLRNHVLGADPRFEPALTEYVRVVENTKLNIKATMLLSQGDGRNNK